MNKRRDLMLSGISCALLLIIIYFVRFNESVWLLYLAGIFLGISIVYPHILKPINCIVQPAGKFLIDLSVKIILVIIFYLVFSPIAIFRRIFSRNSMITTNLERENDTYFVDKEKQTYNKDFFERLY